MRSCSSSTHTHSAHTQLSAETSRFDSNSRSEVEQQFRSLKVWFARKQEITYGVNSPHSLSQSGENIYTWTELTYIKRVVYLRAAVFSTASGPASRVFVLLARWQQVFFFYKETKPN